MRTTRSPERHHILCIDDNVPGLEVRRLLLQHWGYSVTTAVSGEEGLAFLKHSEVDAVIVDYTMPGMDGGQVARFVKEQWPELRIIMLSGRPRIPARAKTCIDAFVEKGIRSERLRSVLADLLEGEELTAHATVRRTKQLLRDARQSLSRTCRGLLSARRSRRRKRQ